MPNENKNLILLTGAGFTRNFGGFLAREMWSKIFNNPSVQAREKVRDVLSKDFDFESVYAEVLRGFRYDDDDKSALRTAVEQAYKELDDTVKNWSFNDRNPSGLNIYGLGDLIAIISHKGSDQGCFFTLNQDLYMERARGFKSPGVLYSSMDPVASVRLPNESEVEAVKSTLNNASYIKLHGSYGWVSSLGGTQMVIGKNKSEDIEREPLLRWYLELFENAIYEGNKKLLVIGYGFRDDHINNILLKGVQEHALSLYVVNTTDPESFKNLLEGRPSDNRIWEVSKYFPIWEKGIKGYFPYSLREIYPPDQSETSMAQEIKRALQN